MRMKGGTFKRALTFGIAALLTLETILLPMPAHASSDTASAGAVSSDTTSSDTTSSDTASSDAAPSEEASSEAASSDTQDQAAADTETLADAEAVDYDEYSASYSAAPCPQQSVTADSSAVSQPVLLESYLDVTGALLSPEQTELAYTLEIPAEGLYRIAVTYYGIEGKGKDIVLSLSIDGRTPFREAGSISLSRIWTDDGEIQRDVNGNDLRPSQVEVKRWNTALLSDSNGYYNDPFAFYFSSAGTHTVTLAYEQESVVISQISVCAVETPVSYQEYSKNAAEAEKTLLLFEAEDSYEKSSSMLYPTYDRSSAATSPSHYSKIRYNTIGQSNWSQQGQWISWEIAVDETGWYSLSFKARQNYQQGVNAYRRLKIDGEVPFREVDNIAFPYSLNWYMATLSDDDGEPYLFYLEAGTHILTLEVAAGPMGSVLKGVSNGVLRLNEIYRSIIMVTGTSPDKYRTYYLDEDIPGLMEEMQEVKELLDQLYAEITRISGTGGSQASVILEMSTMLEEFLDKPLEISERVSAFKDTIESMGSVILTLSEQPLELDYIVVSADSKLPSAKAGFFESLIYHVKGFFASFKEDYNSVSSSEDDTEAQAQITVWISSGRDQAQLLKNLIDNYFTPETGISVSLSIVSTAANTSSSTLVQATLAGKGPDVALFTPRDTPVNLAMRGALADLSQLEGFDEIYEDFYPSAWIPYEYEDGIYAVPETQNFDMLFYRTDIFGELGLSAPETWEEFYTVIEVLQKYNLEMGVLETNSANAGVSSGISFFEKLLLQNGGTYYNQALTQTAFDTPAAYEAFAAWTELYSEYGLDRSFDFYNRFRTGEMPIGIMNYTMYNQLSAAAPEIRGLWTMTCIPGTRQEDGTVLRTETASGTGAVILADSAYVKESWEFLKWWVSDETQALYGRELEASLGIVARYDTANRTAFESIGWTDEEAEALKLQWCEVTDIKQIPGNYFISRCLTNAFRSVVDDDENPVRALNIYNKDMNAEITRKRKEFGLSLER